MFNCFFCRKKFWSITDSQENAQGPRSLSPPRREMRQMYGICSDTKHIERHGSSVQFILSQPIFFINCGDIAGNIVRHLGGILQLDRFFSDSRQHQSPKAGWTATPAAVAMLCWCWAKVGDVKPPPSHVPQGRIVMDCWHLELLCQLCLPPCGAKVCRMLRHAEWRIDAQWNRMEQNVYWHRKHTRDHEGTWHT